MSSHESIAAQFWLWPDPVMKRDSQGRILFINAAFLQLYGGTVEAWTGNVLQGWPAPQPTEPGTYPVPYRFETRMPSQDPNKSEDIYDWIEQNAPDGTAFALARNVSPFVSAEAPQPQTPQTQDTAPHQLAAQQQASHQPAYEEPEPASYPDPAYDTAPEQPHYAHDNAAPAETSQEYEPLPAPATTQEPSEYQDANAATEPALPPKTEQPPVSQEQQDFQAIAEMASEDAPAAEEESSSQGPETSNPNAQSQTTSETGYAAQPSPSEAETSEKRDFERRALPLEENSTVLGNNWRDAVIAKAIGVEEETPPAKGTPPEAGGGASADAPQTGPAPDSGASQGPEKRILLAEDNAINALLTRTLLEAEGHTVETVEDGVLAVEAMKSQSYDLIFMDMRMPNMDGLEATRKIRALPNVTKELPIIALTANAFDDDRNACFDSGMNDFMTKPVSAEELTQMVRTWTGDQAKKDAA